MRFQAVIVLLALAVAAAPAASQPLALFGSGFLIPYYGGVAEVLSKAGVLNPNTSLAGSSSGAWAALGIVIGLSPADLLKTISAMAAGESLAEVLAAVLPDNITELASGRVTMGIAQLDASQTSMNNSAAWLVDKYESKADVLEAMLATACLPCFLQNTTYCIFRDQPVLDVSWEQLCPGGDTDNCVKVSAQTTAAVETDALPGPECAGKWPTRQDTVNTLYQNDAHAAGWALEVAEPHCPESAYEGQPSYPVPEQVQDWYPVLPDIFPGKYGALPELNGTQITACEWESWTLGLPKGLEVQAVQVIYGQGAKDATMWLAERRATKGAGR